ncbi:MAG: response regulator transcription factor [Desulfobacterales bacterium]|nr:MAG: response regulator transcription factor [Desulfobacterales bacterium]
MPNKCPYRVVVADDHAVFRHNLKRILRERSDLEVAGEAGDGVELLAILCLIAPAAHMAIVDIAMPHIGGIEATAAIKRTYPGMKVLILSMHREKQYVHEAMSAGADGYLLKEDADADLFPAIEKIRGGGVYLSPLLNEMERV